VHRQTDTSQHYIPVPYRVTNLTHLFERQYASDDDAAKSITKVRVDYITISA